MVDEKRIAISRILNNFNNYLMENKTFKIDILPFEWEAFFDVLYEYTVIKKLKNHFYYILNIIFNNAIIKYQSSEDHKFELYLVDSKQLKKYNTNILFTLDTLLNSLWTLCAYEFKESEIDEIKEEIRFRCMEENAIDITNIVKK